MAQTKLEHLDDNINGLVGLLDDRNTLLNFMFKEDQYKDFLMAEKLQSMEDAAGLNVQPVKAGTLDLSPINNLLPNEIRHNVAGRIDPKIINIPNQNQSTTSSPRKDRSGMTDKQRRKDFYQDQKNKPSDDKTKKLKAGGITSSFNSPGVKSLAETGFDDTFYKNISSSIEDDFKISDVLKQAFGDAMALPVRAAAAALSDLISKIPVQSASQKEVLNENISNVSSAFHLQRNNSIQETINRQQTTTDHGETVNKWVNSLLNTSTTTQIAQGKTNRKLNLLNPFHWPAILDEADKARSGERTINNEDRGVPGSILNYNQRNAEYMKMLSSNTIRGDLKTITFDGKTYPRGLPGSGETFGGKGGSTYTNNVSETLVPITDTVTNNLTTLTDQVLTENRIDFDENTIIEKAVAQLPQPPDKTPPGPMEIGDDKAISKVIHSPFFDEYSKMTQFDYVS